jgi:hypothetical protein
LLDDGLAAACICSVLAPEQPITAVPTLLRQHACA